MLKPNPKPDTPSRRRSELSLPIGLAVRWGSRISDLPWGTVRPSGVTAIKLRRVLQAHAAELVPHILGGGSVDVNGMLHGCPSSDDLRRLEALRNGGSGPPGLRG